MLLALCAVYVAAGTAYLLHFARLNGISDGLNAESDLSGFIARAAWLTTGGIITFGLLLAFFKRVGIAATEKVFRWIMGVIVVTNVFLAFWIPGIFTNF